MAAAPQLRINRLNFRLGVGRRHALPKNMLELQFAFLTTHVVIDR